LGGERAKEIGGARVGDDVVRRASPEVPDCCTVDDDRRENWGLAWRAAPAMIVREHDDLGGASLWAQGGSQKRVLAADRRFETIGGEAIVLTTRFAQAEAIPLRAERSLEDRAQRWA